MTFLAMNPESAYDASQGGEVSIAYVRSLFDYLTDHGYSPASLFGKRTAESVERQDAFGTLPVLEWARLFDVAEAATGDPNLALHVGEAIKPRHFGILGYVTMSCSTLGEAIDRLLRYEALVGELSHSELRVDDGIARLRWRSPIRPIPPRVLSETAMAGWVSYGQWLLGGDYPAEEVSFEHAAPPDTREHQRIFRCPVHFAADHTGLAFPAEYLDRRLIQHDPAMRALLDAQAEARLRELQRLSPLHRRAREATRTALMQGRASLANLARDLGMAPRTLERRLHAEGLSYRRILDEARLNYARDLLGDPEARLSEVALLLGYSEQSAFTRAFRRWTGMTPARYRDGHGD
ncbi:AraC family transcriptional regulator [Ectothiorhodospiraceae bacterium WFHF3C12]|nr:AraC family transcriptional regulator [Ectothiorhodospiraceae bacterium WFHF3C12]